jgi:hypothetical protein
MASWEDVRRLALAMPEAEEHVSYGSPSWRVRKKAFVWERPLRKTDLEALGDAAPDGPILAAWIEHLGAKEAMVRSEPGVFFTTPHFDGYAIVLVRLAEIALDELEEVIAEAWLRRAPKRLAREYLESPGS